MTTNAKAADTARCGNTTATIIPMITNTETKAIAIIIIYVLLPKKLISSLNSNFITIYL